MILFLRMKKERILKEVLKMKLKRKCLRRRPNSSWEQPVRKAELQMEGRTW
jgi:hypothetical protein